MEKKSFVFYTSWNQAIQKMDEQQLRRFINNLCNYAEGNEVHLDGIVDEIMWSQVKPLLDHNETKRQRRIEGGRKGGLAKPTNDKHTQAGLSILSVEGRGKKVDDEGRRMMEEGRRLKVDVDVEGRGKKVDVDVDVEGRCKKVESMKGEIIVEVDGEMRNFDFDSDSDIKNRLYSMNLPKDLLNAMLVVFEPEGLLTKKQRELILNNKNIFEKLGYANVLKDYLELQ
jgi:hypothetical protein